MISGVDEKAIISLDTQTNAMFVDRRAGTSEYLLLKRGFGTCTRIVHASGLATVDSVFSVIIRFLLTFSVISSLH